MLYSLLGLGKWASLKLSLQCGPGVVARISPYASLRSPSKRATMFTKALREHPQPAKPLYPNLDRLLAKESTTAESTADTKPNPKPQTRSSLGDLHSGLEFDSDFNDEELLEIDRVIQQSSQLPIPSETTKHDTGTVINDIPLPATGKVVSRGTALPPSSAPLPWSSSPPSHHRKFPPKKAAPVKSDAGRVQHDPNPAPIPNPPTKRTLPWNDSVDQKRNDPKTASKASRFPWTKTMSAVKEEQKQLRKQNSKNRTQEERKLNQSRIPTKVPSMFFSDEQNQVIEAIVKNKKSIFYTGSAGTGKSVLMREIIRQLREKYRKEPDAVAVTASTGLAACNIEGVTLHSFAGVGLGKETVQELTKKVGK